MVLWIALVLLALGLFAGLVEKYKNPESPVHQDDFYTEEQEVVVKKCSRCKELQTLDNFYNMQVGTHGKDGYCKPCRKEKNREYNASNRESLNAYMRYYRAAKRKN